jgi:hypothetical protein
MDIPLDSYLNVLKPKPVVYKTPQQIFDKALQVLFNQKGPCIRTEDSSGEMSPSTFNLYNHRSPLLSMVSIDRLRILQRGIGYETLRDLTDLKSKISPSTDSTSPLVRTLTEVLALEGVGPFEIALLADLEERHLRCAKTCIDNNWIDHPSLKMSAVYNSFSDAAWDWGLQRGALKFYSP